MEGLEYPGHPSTPAEPWEVQNIYKIHQYNSTYRINIHQNTVWPDSVTYHSDPQ